MQKKKRKFIIWAQIQAHIQNKEGFDQQILRLYLCTYLADFLFFVHSNAPLHFSFYCQNPE